MVPAPVSPVISPGTLQNYGCSHEMGYLTSSSAPGHVSLSAVRSVRGDGQAPHDRRRVCEDIQP